MPKPYSIRQRSRILYTSQTGQKFFVWLIIFSLMSLLGQYGCMIRVDLSLLLGEGWWIPLGAITIVPLVDVSCSFAQHYAEQSGLLLKHSLAFMMTTSFVISLLFSLFGSLPVNMCVATFAAVNVGGLVDLLVFRAVIKVSCKPYIRMLFSNLLATLTGGALFYQLAYTRLLDNILGYFKIQHQNPILMDDLLKGWLCQSILIWLSGVSMAVVIGKLLEYHETKHSTIQCPASAGD
ncbi:hypothetical protein [Endozoicomonas numazuensis]|nr:hypothetical protein [Endozoicomonas numazuensis]